ncbi:hypothetical protein [Rhizobium leguminosarum]|uniref:hypothetical protein n=1 Tax=Rhizobium leguminosarum TaxID=384 RepID=UPI001C96ABEE|nr:hypothetical protein [Rhizobium leguminosarum]MBY5821435.1 hypothetical protein [Rhizobium leguminosarum]
MTTEERAFEAAWKACSAWDGKITKPVLRKVIEAYVKEVETPHHDGEEEAFFGLRREGWDD